ncbi:MAG: TIGR03503 family protein [Psychrobium sp.]
MFRQLLIIGVIAMALTLPASANNYNPNDNASQQKIKLLSNRFRVDQAVDALVFIIERKPGSAPIILVRPDGSKLYATRQVDGVKWVDGNAGDMIEIKQPMIGPWQIIGDILPSSEIRLATSLALKIDEFPNELFVGEIAKLIARIEFNNKLLALGRVDDLIKLDVFLRSTSDTSAPNFGAGTFTIGQYIDDGQGLDERRGDGVFTGRLDINKPNGPYTLLVRAGNKVFEREYSQPLYLRPQPVNVDLMSAAIDGQYALRFITNDQAVEMAQMAIQVIVHHPDETQEHLSISNLAPTHLLRLENVQKPGRYKIDVEVFGTTTSGREFRYNAEQMKVKIEVPAAKEVKAQKVEADKARKAKFKREQLLKRRKAAEQKAEEEKALIIIIVMVNVLILILGGLLMWLFLRKKKPKKPKEDKKDADNKDEKDDKKGKDSKKKK